MGKENFKELYRRIKTELNTITCKTSFYCDRFDPARNYAGVIVYAIDGKFQWKNYGGQANGYNGKSFYIIVQCTDNWPDEYRTASGQERAHDYLLKNVMGLDYDQSRITCGGFTYTDGELKFSSTWLNNKDQKGAKSDGNKFLSEPEKTLVTFCFDEYKKYGNHHIFEIPSSVDKEFSE